MVLWFDTSVNGAVPVDSLINEEKADVIGVVKVDLWFIKQVFASIICNVFASHFSELIVSWVLRVFFVVGVTFISLRRWITYTSFTVHIMLEPSSPSVETREKLFSNTASSDTEWTPITRLLVNGVGFEFRKVFVPWVCLTFTVRDFGSWFHLINSRVIPVFSSTSNCLSTVWLLVAIVFGN